MKPKVSYFIHALNEEKRIAALIDDISLMDKKYNYDSIF